MGNVGKPAIDTTGKGLAIFEDVGGSYDGLLGLVDRENLTQKVLHAPWNFVMVIIPNTPMGHSIQKLSFDDANLYMTANGTKYRVALSAISLRLLRANQAQRETYRLSPAGFTIFWTKLGLEVPVNGLLQMCQKIY